MDRIRTILKRCVYLYPCIFLLFFIYLFFIPRVISYNNSWAIPEILHLDGEAFRTGGTLCWQDIKRSFNDKDFDDEQRISRPWSQYFQIVDAKFRSWAWQYILPHPSLSLTWVFSLVLTPLLLFLLLRNLGIDPNTAMGMTAFFIMTPTSLSHLAELFRPAKPMADFAIIFCLYWASSLEKKFLQKGQPILCTRYIFFWAVSALFFYWDETALLIFPAVLFFTPKVIFHRKWYVFLWLLLPFIAAISYFVGIPYLTTLAGYGHPNLTEYYLFKRGILITGEEFYRELVLLPTNTKSLVLGTMGIIVPDAWQASWGIKACLMGAVLSWGVILFHIRKVLIYRPALLIFIIGLIFLNNHLVFVLWQFAWGAFWYGGFWSVFFTIWITLLIHKARIHKYLLAISLFFILINMYQGFIAVNIVYKKNHYYPYNMRHISAYFQGQYKFFNRQDSPRFTGEKIKQYIYSYWMAHKLGLTHLKTYCLPAELNWLVIELDPNHQHPPLERQILVEHERKDFIDTLKATNRCNGIPDPLAKASNP